MLDLKAKPFYLSDSDIEWVESTLSALSTDEKIGQLFCPVVLNTSEGYLRGLLEQWRIGGLLFREGIAEEVRASHLFLQNNSKVPLLTAANLEMGGTGSVHEGTFYGKQMAVAATGNPERAWQLGHVACSEGAAVGVNWSFAPIVDIDMNFRNPITNIRTFGDDPDRVLTMAREYCRAAADAGVATAIKHFPGDGVDERDQHLLTSVNTLSCSEWDQTFGRIYKTLIDDGAPTVMIGHIALPAYEAALGGTTGKSLPATLSPAILQGLLRGKLGFNGLICTDATPMVGFCAAMPRAQAVPLSIEYGCDVFLFNKDLAEDFRYMQQGLASGLLSARRLDEAVTRILALKASLRLHDKQKAGTLVPDESALSILSCPDHVRWANECADDAVTLVKDTQHLLPIDPARHKRVLLQILGDFPSNERVYGHFSSRLTAAGFTVIPYEREDFSKGLPHFDTVEEFKAKFDLVLYIANVDNASNKTVSRINWYTLFGLGNNMPWFVQEVPTAVVSVGNPYHLLDAPMIETFVNGYCNSTFIIDATVDKLLGLSPFKGKSPIDPFCGRMDLNL